MPHALASAIVSILSVFSLILSACGIAPPVASQPPEPVEYDYSQPVPAGDLMGEEWFDDSAIIGHSLMEGFEAFGGLYSNVHYFTTTGLSAAGTTGYSKFQLPNGGTGTLRTGLGQKQFSKIYIMLGVNEISSSSSGFKKNMLGVISLVRELQGEDIPIYVISLTPTTKKKSDATVFNLENTLRLNGVLQELCEEEKCYYIDLYECFADSSGYLPAERSTDGVHLTAGQYKVMADYLKSHTVQGG